MPDVLRGVMGWIVKALASVGVIALIAWIGRLLARLQKTAENPSGSIIEARLRHHIDQDEKTRQAAIEDAATGDDAAAALAALGNQRRETDG